MWSNFNPPRKEFLICTAKVLRVDLGQEHSLGRGERPQAPVLGLPFAVLLKKSLIFPSLFQHGSPCESDLKSNFPLRSAPTWFSLSSAWAAPITCGKTVPKFSFKIWAKVQLQKSDQNPASKSWPNFINCFDSVDWFYQLLAPCHQYWVSILKRHSLTIQVYLTPHGEWFTNCTNTW